MFCASLRKKYLMGQVRKRYAQPSGYYWAKTCQGFSTHAQQCHILENGSTRMRCGILFICFFFIEYLINCTCYNLKYFHLKWNTSRIVQVYNAYKTLYLFMKYLNKITGWEDLFENVAQTHFIFRSHSRNPRPMIIRRHANQHRLKARSWRAKFNFRKN